MGELYREERSSRERAEPVVKLVTRKPITASAGELEVNPRSRSASLRIAEKL